MGTRQVYEEKLRRANLEYDPTMNPGLGSARCPRCLSLLTPNSEKGEWTITPVLHDAAAVAGSGIGGLLSAVNAFNTGNLGSHIFRIGFQGRSVSLFLSGYASYLFPLPSSSRTLSVSRVRPSSHLLLLLIGSIAARVMHFPSLLSLQLPRIMRLQVLHIMRSLCSPAASKKLISLELTKKM
ncbi:hypothetical protein YC2023_028616 [Brassica napus]